MTWTAKLLSALFPEDGLGKLSLFDKLRFIALLNMCWVGVVGMLTIATINTAFSKNDRAFDNVVTTIIYALPTLWLTYRYKIRLASWYGIISMYGITIWLLYTRLSAQADAHVELLFIMIGIFSVILLPGKAALIIPAYLVLNYLIARLIVFHYLQLPVEIGQLNCGLGVFVALLYFINAVKTIVLQMQRSIVEQNTLLEVQNKDLSALNELKDKLFGIIGHDLRSPVAIMQLSLTNLAAEQPPAGKFEQRYGRLIQLVDGVYNTVDNLLNWSLLQRNGLLIHPTRFELRDLAESVQNLYSVEFQSKQITLITNYQSALVDADEYQLQIVLRNLVHNAIKFTPVGGQISITTHKQDGRAVLIVQDSGVGMDLHAVLTEQQPYIVSRGTAGEKGTGLGLEICREFVRLNNGQLQIQSTLEKGTVVTVSFG